MMATRHDSRGLEVDDLLQSYVRHAASPASRRFAARCRQAAGGYRAVFGLRRALSRIGFEPLPFGEYMERLAYAAGASLSSAWELVGVEADATDRYEHRARLGAALRIPLRQLLVHLRLQLLADAGALPARARCDLNLDGASVVSAEYMIAEALGELKPEAKERMQMVVRSVTSWYRESVGAEE